MEIVIAPIEERIAARVLVAMTVSAEEKRRIAKAAALLNMSVSRFSREVVKQAAERVLEQHAEHK